MKEKLIGAVRSAGSFLRAHSALAMFALGIVFLSAGARAEDFVAIDGTTGALTFAPTVVIAALLNTAVSAANACIPLLELAASLWLILRMFGLLGRVKR